MNNLLNEIHENSVSGMLSETKVLNTLKCRPDGVRVSYYSPSKGQHAHNASNSCSEVSVKNKNLNLLVALEDELEHYQSLEESSSEDHECLYLVICSL